MRIIKRRAHARAGLIGNPSDGYGGKTISTIVRNFWAEVVLYEWEDVEILSSQEDQSRFGSIRELIRDVKVHGYYGGLRLVKATIKRFAEYCAGQSIPLHDRNFSIRYESNVPRAVGLAGSSAIIVATLRALMDFFDVSIPRVAQPSLALSVEKDELGISAGLQDRVIQVYEGVVAMDFSPSAMRQEAGLTFGDYESLDPSLLPPLYVAYSHDAGEPTEVFHNNLKARFDAKEAAVLDAMRVFAQLTDSFREALAARDLSAMHRLINRNFDTRRSICVLPESQTRMVEVARSTGASAKFAGSGGAIIGAYDNESTYHRLEERLGALGCKVIKPIV